MAGWFYLIFMGVLLLAVLIIGAINIANPNLIKGKYSKSLIWGLLVLASAFILFSLSMPLLMPQLLKIVGTELAQYNELGDAVGGMMNPFIAISAVIVTGLAFFMQYQANNQIREQFKLQQFEAQFYEMLRLHKQNVEEIELNIYTEKKRRSMIFKGKKDSDMYDFSDPTTVRGRRVFVHYVQEFHTLLSCIGVSKFSRIDQNSFSEAYHIFFSGLPKTPDQEDLFEPTLAKCARDNIRELKSTGLAQHGHLHSYFDLFTGHVEYLGHYYRHLYMTVKYVVEGFEKHHILTSEKECLKYLKVLRAQLSNAEQVMLFYNWIAGGGSGYGANWEKDNRQYFSRYLMLHNLHFGTLFSGPNYFIKRKVQDIFLRSEKKKKLFEHNVEEYIGSLDNV